MQHILEDMREDALERNEFYGSQPNPLGAFDSFEAFRDFVNINQQDAPINARPLDHYQNIDNEKWKHLRDVIIPETLAMVYVVVVPLKATVSHITTLYVPTIDELEHDPDLFGFSEELDLERKLRVPRHFPHWLKFSNDGQQMSLQYAHIDTIGIDAGKRVNGWRTFSDLKLANRYLAHVKHANIKPSPRSMRIVEALDELV